MKFKRVFLNLYKKMNRIGLVLSGGGVRGFGHLGILKVLDELQIKPCAISGVSAGAILERYMQAEKPLMKFSFLPKTILTSGSLIFYGEKKACFLWKQSKKF